MGPSVYVFEGKVDWSRVELRSVQATVKFELAVNLKAAKAIGLVVPHQDHHKSSDAGQQRYFRRGGGVKLAGKQFPFFGNVSCDQALIAEHAIMLNKYSKKFLPVPCNTSRRHSFPLVRNEGEGT